MRLVLPAVVILVLLGMSLAAVEVSEASCASPHPAFQPASGTTLPPRPTIYAFVPDLYGGEVTVVGADFRVEELATNDAFKAIRIRVLSGDPGQKITVRYGARDGDDDSARFAATYEIGDPTPNRARVVGVAHHTHEWTCSYANTIKLRFQGNAPAYRLAWSDGTTTVLPADGGALWTWSDEPQPTPAVTEAELGHPNCMAHTVDPELLGKPRAFELYALFVDGSEVRIGTSTAQLGDAGIRLPTELVSQGYDAETVMSPPRTVVIARVVPWWTAATGALGGLVVLAGMVLLSRRRRRDHAPRQ